jgi:hypothetical protein
MQEGKDVLLFELVKQNRMRELGLRAGGEMMRMDVGAARNPTRAAIHNVAKKSTG